MNRSDVLFLSTILIHFSLFLIAITCLRYRLFRPVIYWLLTYAVISIYIDYAVAMVKIDRLVGWGGTFWHHVVLAPNVNFILDAIARVAVFIAIWLGILTLRRSREINRSIDSY